MMKPSTYKSVIATLFLVLSGATATAENEQRECTFKQVLTTNGDMPAADWEVIAAQNGTAARVVVIGSGDYPGTARDLGNGGAEFMFSTDVSNEILTASAGGEALWQVNFHDGQTMAYFGTCGAARRTQ